MSGRNKGFTLVELMVSVAILGILIAAEVAFLSSGANVYRVVYNNVDLQVESQTILNQMEDAVINCSGGMSYQNNTLYVIDPGSGGSDEYDEYEFSFASGALTYTHNTITVTNGTPAAPVLSESAPLSAHVKSFGVAFQPTVGNVISTKISLGLAQQSSSFAADKTVDSRNKPVQAASEAGLIQEVCK